MNIKLPYNPKLKQRARELRKAGNLSEVLIWQKIKNKQLLGLDFDRQKIIGNYIVDFYSASINVVIEINGSSHDNKQEYDAIRQSYLEGLGLKVIRIQDKDVKTNLDSVDFWRIFLGMILKYYPVSLTTATPSKLEGEFVRLWRDLCLNIIVIKMRKLVTIFLIMFGMVLSPYMRN